MQLKQNFEVFNELSKRIECVNFLDLTDLKNIEEQIKKYCNNNYEEGICLENKLQILKMMNL